MVERRTSVLIIGEEDDVRDEIERALTTAGFHVRTVATADETADDPALEAAGVVVWTADGAAEILMVLQGDSALGALRSQNAELEAFASRASHDLKTPLAVISGTADTLRHAWDRLKESDRDQLLEAMSSQAVKAAAMINDLLLLARTDPEERSTAIVADVRSVVVEAVARLPLLAEDDVDIESTWPPLTLPLSDLKSILSNLVDNAHHYGRSADGVLRLRAGWAPEGDLIRISVEDEGPGVPEELRAFVFQPDGRLEGSQLVNPHSTGMGLAIVRRCAERCGGDTGITSSSKGGATFWVTLPAALQVGAGA